jgi:hypothetical protein
MTGSFRLPPAGDGFKGGKTDRSGRAQVVGTGWRTAQYCAILRKFGPKVRKMRIAERRPEFGTCPRLASPR